jgi:hypothetical protein
LLSADPALQQPYNPRFTLDPQSNAKVLKEQDVKGICLQAVGKASANVRVEWSDLNLGWLSCRDWLIVAPSVRLQRTPAQLVIRCRQLLSKAAADDHTCTFRLAWVSMILQR